MSEIPDYQTLMLPILRLAAQRETTIPLAVEKLATEFGLTPEQMAQRIPSGGFPLFNNRAHWAKTYLVKAGLLYQPRRGAFLATDEGRKVLSTSPKRIDNAFLSRYEEFRRFLRKSSAHDVTPTASDNLPTAAVATPEERIDSAIEEIDAGTRDELLERLFAIEDQSQRAAFFEDLVIRLLSAMGYGEGLLGSGERLGGAGDGGVDGVVRLDALGIDRVYVQAKCYDRASKIQPAQVRDFSGSLDDKKTSRGVFITTAQFTESARRYVDGIQKQIVLIDGDELSRLMHRFNVGVREDRTVIIKRIDDKFFGA